MVKELPECNRRAALELIAQSHPNINLRSITARYNCAGLIVAARRAHADIDQVRQVLQDDGYRKLAGIDESKTGDVVFYAFRGKLAHVGLIQVFEWEFLTAKARVTVLSKWGDGGEYSHDILDVPEVYGVPVEFWTDRKVL